ncbi:MAG: LacI family DNA-binding transcriptional regulator [Acutalibacteraceae bacterium]
MSRVTLKDIASDLNISIGTVNRALNNKAEISEETRLKVLKRAEELNYKKNAIATSLGSKKAINIVFVNTRSFGEFYRDIEAGILDTIDHYEDYNIKLKNIYLDGFEDKEAFEKLEKSLDKSVDAVIMVAINDEFLKKSERLLNKKKIPFVVLDGEFSYCNSMSRICINTYKSGQIAGFLMRRFLREDEEVILLLGNQDHIAHITKRNGFLDTFYKNNYYQISYNDNCNVCNDVKTLLENHPKIKGVYATTSYFDEAIEAIKELKLSNHIFFIGTDITKKKLNYLQQEDVDLLLYQAPFEQGKAAIDVLYRHFFLSEVPDKVIYVKPEIVTKYNYDYYFVGE